MIHKFSTQLFNQILLAGSLTLLVAGSAVAATTPNVENTTNLTTSQDGSYLISEGLSSDSSSKKNYVGPTISLGSGATLFGVNSKFGATDNISVRPFFQFASVDGASVSFYGASATYDFVSPQSTMFTPYAGLGYIGVTVSAGSFSGSGSGLYGEVGADYNASDSIVLNTSYRSILSAGGGGYFSIGGGLKF